PLPATGPVLVVSNHTCSADPPLLQTASRRVFCWLASREQYDQHWLVRKLFDRLHCVPINPDREDAGAARAALQRLREGAGGVGVIGAGSRRAGDLRISRREPERRRPGTAADAEGGGRLAGLA